MNDDVRSTKEQIRLRASARRKAMTRGEKQRLDFSIASKALGLWKLRESPCLLLYCSTAQEVDTRRLIERCWASGKTVALPRCQRDSDEMAFYVVRSWEELEPGLLSIPEPKEHCPPVPADTASVCIVPGLAFDRSGHRVGYGKGYYDRFLATYRGAAIGLVYECCLEAAIPQERFDRRTDIVVTEKEIYFCNN